MRKIYIIVLIMFILISPVTGEDNQSVNNNTTYRVLVDQHHGFYRVYQVYNATSSNTIYYENGTLNISRGDTIIWINDAVPDARLTIVSEEKLWDWHDGTLKWSYKQFAYTFNKSGIYDVYIKERPSFQQKIIVGPLDNTNITNKTVNQTNITKPNLTINTTYKTINIPTNNSTVPVTVPLEKRPGTEAVVLITVTSLLIYVFERKIK